MPHSDLSSPEAQELATLVRSTLASEYFDCELDDVPLDRELLRSDEDDTVAMQAVFLVDVIIDLEEELGLEEVESDIDAEELLSTGGTVGDLVRLLLKELG